MFLTSNCIETKSNVIEIEDIKLIVMEVLIKYMYLGKLDDIGSIAIDLFKAADKYKIKGLKVSFFVYSYLIYFLRSCALKASEKV
jgi:hypothetical protein